jgi:hypothetical protein
MFDDVHDGAAVVQKLRGVGTRLQATIDEDEIRITAALTGQRKEETVAVTLPVHANGDAVIG